MQFSKISLEDLDDIILEVEAQAQNCPPNDMVWLELQALCEYRELRAPEQGTAEQRSAPHG